MNSSSDRLWYTSEAGQDWNRALPIGNGRLGAMVFGNVINERVQLNEDTVWNGGPRDRINPSARRYLPEIQQFLREGRLAEANALTNDALAGIPDSMRCYEPLADLLISFEHAGVDVHPTNLDQTAANQEAQFDAGLLTHYARELDLTQGIAKVAYTLGGIDYTRTLIASPVDGVIAIRLEASTPGSISLRLHLERGPHESYSTRYADTSRGYDDRRLLLSGKAGGEGGVGFAAHLQALPEGGETLIIGETLVIRKANAVTLLFAAATTFRHADPAAQSIEQTRRAASKSWPTLLADHVSAFRSFSDRVQLDLGSTATSTLPTDQRLARLLAGETDPALAALYFNFGRYLTISASWPGSLPANLQGIWNQEFWPAWGAKYTVNINTEMNYWPVEVANLAECHQPLFDLMERVAESGRKTAREMYGCGGFVAHHNTDLWADTCPTDRNLAASYWLMGGAWLSLHLWEHYRFGGDLAFLKKAYPILKDASLFFLDFLIEDARGRLIVSPTASPENLYRLPNGECGVLSAGSSMDSQILTQLFSATRSAARQLGEDGEFRARLQAAQDRLPKPTVGSDGRLLEWPEEYEEFDLQHRHVSHAFALFPGSTITPGQTPELARALRKTLEVRGDEGTGWCMAWKCCLWARLGDGNHAYTLLKNLLTPVDKASQGSNTTAYEGGGSYPNLFCAHPPFQIDGNFGGTAAIAEMLLQSHETRPDSGTGEEIPVLHLLPALPDAWPEGSVSGFRARGGFELSFAWQTRAVRQCTVRSEKGGRCLVRHGEAFRPVELPPGGAIELSF
ncbi:MAG: glycoside hydrolase N-terminal domain-containing protein [Chthoniobacteraceae bacterium]